MANVVLTIFSLLSMLIFITLCTRCKTVRKRSSCDAYGFAPPSSVHVPAECEHDRSSAEITRDDECHPRSATYKVPPLQYLWRLGVLVDYPQRFGGSPSQLRIPPRAIRNQSRVTSEERTARYTPPTIVKFANSHREPEISSARGPVVDYPCWMPNTSRREIARKHLWPCKEYRLGQRVTEEREHIVESRTVLYRSNNLSVTPTYSVPISLSAVELGTIGPGCAIAVNVLTERNGNASGVSRSCDANQYGSNTSRNFATDMDAKSNQFQNRLPGDGRSHEGRSQCTTSARSRSAIPLPVKRAQSRWLTDRTRRLSGDEGRYSERKVRDDCTAATPLPTRIRSSRADSEEAKRLRLGTIYTAKDYISTVDMGKERPWPMSDGMLFNNNFFS